MLSLQPNLSALSCLHFALSPRREFNGRVAFVCFFAAADAKPLSPPQFAATHLTHVPITESNLASSWIPSQKCNSRSFDWWRFCRAPPSPEAPDTLLLPLLGAIGSRFQFRAVGRTYLSQGTTPQGGFFPLPYHIPADVSYVFPHSVPLPVVHVSFPQLEPP